MFGKIFESMYEGSMVGAGAMVFAVWSYVIAKQKPNKEHGSIVRLHPVTVAAAIGEDPKDVEKALDFLCSPDKRSQNKECQGKRLIQISEFDYRVVSGKYYRAIRSEEERVEYQRLKQAEYRAKKKAMRNGKPITGENLNQAMVEAGASEAQFNAVESEFMEKFEGGNPV